MRILLLALYLWLLCFAFGCSMPTAPSSVDAALYWPDAEYRIGEWFSWNEHCATNYIKPSVTIVEGSPETCTYNGPNNRITINPIYTSGCMAHELGHAALEQAGNKCWREYEHNLAERP